MSKKKANNACGASQTLPSNGSRRAAFHPTNHEKRGQLAADHDDRFVFATPRSNAAHGARAPSAPRKPPAPAWHSALLNEAGRTLKMGELRMIANTYSVNVDGLTKDGALVHLNKQLRLSTPREE